MPEKKRLTNQEIHALVKSLIKTTDYQEGLSSIDNMIFGDDYYDALQSTGTVGLNRSVGTPTNNTINRYYDEKRNYSVLVPVRDPLNVSNLSRMAKENIQKNDWSESYFFSSMFDKEEIDERWMEKNLIYSKRLEWMRIKEIKRRPPFSQFIAFQLLILDKLDNILRYNTKQYILDKIERKPQGKSFYTNAVFPQTNGACKIDFRDLTKCINIPSGVTWNNFPSTELFSIIIKMDAGGPIQIATNEGERDLSTYIDLKVGEEWKIENSDAIVKSLNIKPNGSDATVRITGLF